MSDKMSLFQMQDLEYEFPYHYLPYLTRGGGVRIQRTLSWGLEYLTYMTYVRDRIVALRPTSVLDVGCGDGRLLHMLADYVPLRTGVDLSARAIAFAKAFNPEAELFACPVDQVAGSFELVSCVETLEHVADTDLAAFVESLCRRMAPGGSLLVCVPTSVRPLVRKHWRHYTLELLRDQLSPRFRVQESTWLFRVGLLTDVLNRLLRNRWFLIDHEALRQTIWRVHRRWSFWATERNGSHLVALLKSD